jgi:hypothetical protein
MHFFRPRLTKRMIDECAERNFPSPAASAAGALVGGALVAMIAALWVSRRSHVW